MDPVKPASPLVVVVFFALVGAAVVGTLALWPDGEAGSPTSAQAPQVEKRAISTATAAPPPTPTPERTGRVVAVVSLCSVHYWGGNKWFAEDEVGSTSWCVEPLPQGLELQSLLLKVTVLGDSGELFDAIRPSRPAIAVGDAWPPN